MSLVEVSPSTVMQWKERSTERASMSWSRSAGMAASVKTKASMVAMFGWIMPDPLTMPLMVTGRPPMSTVRVAPFG